MKFIESSRFKKAYKALPSESKEQVIKTLRLLATDIRYPSLHVKKIQSTKDIWAARVNLDCRLSFQIVKDYIILRNVGHHDSTLKNP